MAFAYRCKWCRMSFVARRVASLATPSGRTYWVCMPCLKLGEIGAKAAREQAAR